MVFPETMDPGEAMAIAMNNIVLSDPDRPDPDMTGRGQNLEADNLGLGGGVESSNTFYLKDTSEEEVMEDFHGFEQQEIQASVKRGEFHQSVVDSETWDWPELERKIDYNSLTVLDVNSLPEWLQEEAKNVLSWALAEFSKNTWPRGDYKEMMELLIVFLGGSVENFKFHIPGADHHARWMSKIIYTLKICLLSGQYNLDAETQEKIWECARFQALIYVKYWYMSPVAAKAPLNDLEYYEKLLNWRFVSNQHSFELLSLFRKHMWYLTDRLIPLSLFDSSVSPEVVTEMEMGQGLWKSR